MHTSFFVNLVVAYFWRHPARYRIQYKNVLLYMYFAFQKSNPFDVDVATSQSLATIK